MGDLDAMLVQGCICTKMQNDMLRRMEVKGANKSRL